MRLIETARHSLAETASERIARHRTEVADPLQADPPQPLGSRRVEAQRFDRQRGEGVAQFSWWQDDGTAVHLGKAGRCPGGAERVGNGDAAGNMSAIEPGHKIDGERSFPAPEMGGAGDLDPHSVYSVGRGPRTVAAAPFGQPPQRGGILGRLRRDGDEAREKGERVRQRHPRRKTSRSRSRVDRSEQPPSGGIDHRGERDLVSRRAGIFPI